MPSYKRNKPALPPKTLLFIFRNKSTPALLLLVQTNYPNWQHWRSSTCPHKQQPFPFELAHIHPSSPSWMVFKYLQPDCWCLSTAQPPLLDLSQSLASNRVISVSECITWGYKKNSTAVASSGISETKINREVCRKRKKKRGYNVVFYWITVLRT